MAHHLLPCVLGIVLVGCASSHVRPDAMTGSEYERAAAGHLAAAHEELGRYDPVARSGLPCFMLGMHGGADCMTNRDNEIDAHGLGLISN